jgi:hypothetical protein
MGTTRLAGSLRFAFWCDAAQSVCCGPSALFFAGGSGVLDSQSQRKPHDRNTCFIVAQEMLAFGGLYHASSESRLPTNQQAPAHTMAGAP